MSHIGHPCRLNSLLVSIYVRTRFYTALLADGIQVMKKLQQNVVFDRQLVLYTLKNTSLNYFNYILSNISS
jgi:hypothetical protein